MSDDLPGTAPGPGEPPDSGRHREKSPGGPTWVQPAGAAVLLLLIASTILYPRLAHPSEVARDQGGLTAQGSQSFVGPTPPSTGGSSQASRVIVPGHTLAVAHKNGRSIKGERGKPRLPHGKLGRRGAHPPLQAPVSFRVASFNVLGASHTAARGNKSGYSDGRQRIGLAADLLRNQGVQVAGLQEFEPTQHQGFVAHTGGSWGIYPGGDLRAARNSVVWNSALWDLVEAHTATIPYFRGNRVPIPYVLLQNRETGHQAWFISIHNPTSNAQRGNNQKWRNVATQIERNLVIQLHASGTPVFLLGDFNERYEAFCKVTAGGAAQSASGGSGGPPCQPPAGNVGIDWIFASPDVSFTGYLRHQTPEVRRASDHPLIMATATLLGQE